MPKKRPKKPATRRPPPRRRPRARAKGIDPALAKGLDRAVAGGATVIKAAAGGNVTVSVVVDAGHLVPYAIALDGEVILDSLVSKSTTVSVAAGRHRVTWQFIHGFETQWSHTVSVAVGAGAPK